MSMIDFSLNDIGGVFTSIREAITGNKIKDPEKLLAMVNELETTLINARGRVVEAEANSEHWIVSSWRPLMMLVFVFIIFNNYILVPYMNFIISTFTDGTLINNVVHYISVPLIPIPEDMWGLLKLGITGYIVGRSGEKIVTTLKGD